MAHKAAIKAVAQLTHVDIPTAVHVIRRHPLLEDEIHIEEELINLEESVVAYHGADSLHNYPLLAEHILQEKRIILKHCVGLVVRMLYQKRLPQQYNRDDVDHAVRKLVRLCVEDARRTGKRIDIEVLRKLWPLLSMRQRMSLQSASLGNLRQRLQCVALPNHLPAH